jgi:hypothetical protein
MRNHVLIHALSQFSHPFPQQLCHDQLSARETEPLELSLASAALLIQAVRN